MNHKHLMKFIDIISGIRIRERRFIFEYLFERLCFINKL